MANPKRNPDIVGNPFLTREMLFFYKTWSLFYYKSSLLKVGILVLLLGFAFRLICFGVSPFSKATLLPRKNSSSKNISIPYENRQVLDNHQILEKDVGSEPPPIPANLSQFSSDQDTGKEKCDLFSGDWIPNPSGPAYTNETCHTIEGHQNCMSNGRPDSGYLYWRWKPKDCYLPVFDAHRFLKLMKNKAWALIGDSISRNHVQSLLCLLSKVENPVEIYHDEEYRSKRWRFPSHNFTISIIWSPFLVRAAIFENFEGVSTSEIQLHLDQLDENWTKLYMNMDYIIISTGKWFLKTALYYERNQILGCHYCKGNNFTDPGFNFAYRKALRLVFDFIASSKSRGLVFFRTSSPDHFENGEWSSGGSCTRTEPVKEGEMELKDVNRILLEIELEEFEKAAEKSSGNGVDLRLLDFSRVLLMRPDGHPGPYRKFYPFAKDGNARVQNDCLHWCLPGPIDSWNDVIMEMIVNG